jgi:hypothetical protein
MSQVLELLNMSLLVVLKYEHSTKGTSPLVCGHLGREGATQVISQKMNYQVAHGPLLVLLLLFPQLFFCKHSGQV